MLFRALLLRLHLILSLVQVPNHLSICTSSRARWVSQDWLSNGYSNILYTLFSASLQLCDILSQAPGTQPGSWEKGKNQETKKIMNIGNNVFYVILHVKNSLVNYIAFKKHIVLGTEFMKICKNCPRMAQDSFFPQSTKTLWKLKVEYHFPLNYICLIFYQIFISCKLVT